MGSNCCKSSEVQNSISMQVSLQDDFLSKLDTSLEKIMDHSPIYKSITWVIGNKISEGQYGSIFQAMNHDTGELLAIKRINISSNPSMAEKQLKGLTYEIDLLKSLRHTNIIKYYQTDINLETKSVNLSKMGIDQVDLFASVERIFIVACGTSFYAGAVGKYLIEQIAKVPVETDIASEFRYRNPILPPKTLVVTISLAREQT
jgi:glucosamine 6-phosphate synthetase-like amidotransferase/phosphosugar isomerase protein